MIGNEYWATGVSLTWTVASGPRRSVSSIAVSAMLRAPRANCVCATLSMTSLRASRSCSRTAGLRLGIRFTYGRNIYVPEDGENPETVPANWRAVVAAVAEANGLHNIYTGAGQATMSAHTLLSACWLSASAWLSA